MGTGFTGEAVAELWAEVVTPLVAAPTLKLIGLVLVERGAGAIFAVAKGDDT